MVFGQKLKVLISAMVYLQTGSKPEEVKFQLRGASERPKLNCACSPVERVMAGTRPTAPTTRSKATLESLVPVSSSPFRVKAAETTHRVRHVQNLRIQ